MKVLFQIEKLTKNTYRFKEVENDAGLGKAIGTLYIQRSAIRRILQRLEGKDVDVTTLKVEVEVTLAE